MKKTPASKIEPDDSEAEFNARYLSLQRRDRELTAEIVDLEKHGGDWSDHAAALNLEDEAMALLLGEPAPHRAPVETRNLKHVGHERQVVRRAMELASQLIERERREKQLSRLVARMDEWRRLVKQTAVKVLELQALNRARREFKRSIGGEPSLPCDLGGPRALLGTGEIVGPEPYEFLEEIVRKGIMTRGEIERFKTEREI